MKIYIGADHRGFDLKEKIKKHLSPKDYELKDIGTYSFNPKDDYTIYAEKVGSLVGKDKMAMGILLCGSGVGVDVVANKFDGVRSSIGKSRDQVKAGRNDDDMNVLVIAADYTKEEEAITMVETFLKTPFSGKKRYKKRLSDINKIEANN